MPNPDYATLLPLIAAETDPVARQALIDECYQFIEPLTPEEEGLFGYMDYDYVADVDQDYPAYTEYVGAYYDADGNSSSTPQTAQYKFRFMTITRQTGIYYGPVWNQGFANASDLVTESGNAGSEWLVNGIVERIGGNPTITDEDPTYDEFRVELVQPDWLETISPVESETYKISGTIKSFYLFPFPKEVSDNILSPYYGDRTLTFRISYLRTAAGEIFTPPFETYTFTIIDDRTDPEIVSTSFNLGTRTNTSTVGIATVNVTNPPTRDLTGRLIMKTGATSHTFPFTILEGQQGTAVQISFSEGNNYFSRASATLETVFDDSTDIYDSISVSTLTVN